MPKNNGYEIADFQRSAFRGDRRSRRQAKTFGRLKRYERRAARRGGNCALSDE
jgi:hypothetical protein